MWVKHIRHFSAAIGLSVIACSHSFAQDSSNTVATVSGAKIGERNTEVGLPVTITLEFDSPRPWCGLEVQWGDGAEDTVRVGHEKFNNFPLQITHTYKTPGQFLLKIVGKNISRGLRSATPCGGLPKETTVTVESAQQKAEAEKSRNEANRAKEEADRKYRELEEKEAELRRREEKLERDRRTQDKREQELKAKQQAELNKQNSTATPTLPSQQTAPSKKPTVDPF